MFLNIIEIPLHLSLRENLHFFSLDFNSNIIFWHVYLMTTKYNIYEIHIYKVNV